VTSRSRQRHPDASDPHCRYLVWIWVYMQLI